MACQYSLQTFDECIASNQFMRPTKDVMNIIQSVSEQLRGSSNGNSFNKRFAPRHAYNNARHGSGGGAKVGYGASVTANANQKTTVASAPTNANVKQPVTSILGNVTTGFDSQLLLIRTYLNKTTDKTKADMYTKIFNILSQIIHADMVEENMASLTATIYDISAVNKFYSKLFAGMYMDLVKEFPRLKPYLEAKIAKFSDMTLFDTIRINASDTGYEQTCKNNKQNDILKADTTFLVNVLNLMDKRSTIEATLANLVAQIDAAKMDATKKPMNDELIEYVFILFKSLHPLAKDDGIYVFIKALSQCKAKECPGLASKLIFKCMEMIEM